jgi:hypothetical protein
VTELTDDEVRAARLRAGGVAGRPASAIVDVVRRVVGVQAQEWPSARLAVRARFRRGLTASAVDEERERSRSVVRGWFMRGTLQLVAADDLPWLLAALGPSLLAGSARRLAEVGVTATHVRAVVSYIRRHGPVDRATLAGAVGLTSHQTYHAVRQAALAGEVCYGPGAETWVAVGDWIGRRPVASASDAVVELARRYLAGYGPATVHDLAVWSGLPVSAARRAVAGLGSAVVSLGGGLLALGAVGASRPVTPSVRLLPAYDPYLLGYRDRSLSAPVDHARRVHPGGGLLRPTVIRAGVAVGTWKVGGGIEPFEPGPPWLDEAAAELRDVSRFVGRTSG